MSSEKEIKKDRIRKTVKGERHESEVEKRSLLSDFLREDLGVKGTQGGCEQGVCGK